MSRSSGSHDRKRLRDLGIHIGRYHPGRFNAITDVPGVLVGHSTLIRGEGPLVTGKGPIRTGVTAILPNGADIYNERIVGGGFVLNGAGELAGEPILEKLTRAPGNGASIGGLKVTARNGWFAARPSGTEDVYKIYAESFLGAEHLRRIQEEAREIVGRAMG